MEINNLNLLDIECKALSEWSEVSDMADLTRGKELKGVAKPKQICALIRAVHSPIRARVYRIIVKDVPYWIAMHFRTHWVGVTWFISTQRPDVTGIDRDKLPQDTPVTMACVLNLNALINICKERLCGKTRPETRYIASQIRSAIINYELSEGNKEIVSALQKSLAPKCGGKVENCCEQNPCRKKMEKPTFRLSDFFNIFRRNGNN